MCHDFGVVRMNLFAVNLALATQSHKICGAVKTAKHTNPAKPGCVATNGEAGFSFLQWRQKLARHANGWFKLHRRLELSWISSDGHALAIWVTLLRWALRRSSKAKHSGKIIDIPPGTVVTSTIELAERLGFDRKTVERRLKLLVDSEAIVQRVTKEGRIVTICNWENYQSCDEDESPSVDQQATNNRDIDGTTTGTPIGEEEKKEKEEKEEYISAKEFFNLWNSKCGSLAKASKLTKGRVLKIKTRLAENPDLAYWEATIKRMAKSHICMSGGWANLDFLISNDTNHVKASEGKYDNKVAPTTPQWDGDAWVKKMHQKAVSEGEAG